MHKVDKSDGEEYQVVKRGREYHGYGEECNVGKGKPYHRIYIFEAIFQVGKRGRRLKFRGRKSRLKKGGGEKYQVVGNFIHPWKQVVQQ